jgi:protocatechuate 3,4-dioxygenase beta subunit
MSPIRPYRRYHPGTQPEYFHPPYVSSQKRAPSQSLVHLPHTISEVTGPVFGNDLIGERIIVSGRVIDEDARPLPHTLVEVWQANSAGRYAHAIDQHNAPLDPNFTGCGHTITDAEGRYRFVTIKPGAYPWQNHYNAWRAAHIHFSVFGPAFATRLITQMYFPGDPLMANDPIFNCTADESARNRLVSLFDWETTMPLHALGYEFDIVMSGRDATPFEENHRAHR